MTQSPSAMVWCVLCSIRASGSIYDTVIFSNTFINFVTVRTQVFIRMTQLEICSFVLFVTLFFYFVACHSSPLDGYPASLKNPTYEHSVAQPIPGHY